MKSDRGRQGGAASAGRGRERGQEMRKRRQRRPGVEGLESRRLLTTIKDGFLLSNTSPAGITAGPNDTVWFTSQTNPGQVGMINATTGTMLSPMISVGINPAGIISVPGGNIWFAEGGFPPGSSTSNTAAIGEINPNAPTSSYQHFLTPTKNSIPTGIVYDPNDGEVFFTENAGQSIGMFNPATITSSSNITEFALPSNLFGSTPEPNGITYDPIDHDIWFTTSASNQIGMFDPSTQSFHAYTLPNAGSQPGAAAITVDSNGNLWFAEPNTTQIGMFNTSSLGFGGPYSLPASWSGSTINGITAGPDGNIWITAGNSNIGWFSPGTAQSLPQSLSSLPTPNSAADPFGITTGPDGNIWFAEYSGNNGNGAIGVATPDVHLVVSTPSGVTTTSQFPLTATVVYNDNGAVDTGFDGTVTVSLGNNPGGSTLGGNTTSIPVVNGAATINLALNHSGNGYTLQASGQYGLPELSTALSLSPVSTNPFNVTGTPTPTPTPTTPTPTPTTPTPTPTTPTPTPTTPTPTPTTPTPTPTTPTVTSERVVLTYLRHNKKGKPIGKPVVDFVFQFSTAMDPGTAGNPGDFQVAWASTKKVRKKVVTVLHPIGFSATLSPSGTSVTLATTLPATKFAKGGQITIGGVSSTEGVLLGGSTVFTILAKARGIIPTS